MTRDDRMRRTLDGCRAKVKALTIENRRLRAKVLTLETGGGAVPVLEDRISDALESLRRYNDEMRDLDHLQDAIDTLKGAFDEQG